MSSPVSAGIQSDDVHAWLKRMVNAVHQLNYHGNFVYLHDNNLESMRIIHSVEDGNEHERLISLNGSAREVIRDNASVTCVSPDAKSVSVGKRMLGQGFRAVFSADTRKLTPYYEFKMIGTSRVADRVTKVFAIIPRDRFRYGYRIYLDTENGLPLKSDMLDVDGVLVSQIMFTQLTITDSLEQDRGSLLEGAENYRWEQEQPPQPAKNRESAWRFSSLPGGFKQLITTRKMSRSGDVALEHIVLSDGLASLSVYIEKGHAGNALDGASTMGAINAYGINLPEHHATVVGEVPAGTAELVARALQSGGG